METITAPEKTKIQLASKDECTGCNACYSICPNNAIMMEEDKNGFLYPVINSEKCTDCGLCQKTCPVINKNIPKKLYQKCFAAMAEDNIRQNSSSGGVFFLLADYILSNNGYVCGAAFDYETLSTKHIIVDKKENLHLLQSSKYTQSDVNNCFKDIKKLLTSNKTVLFSGTPCQIAGLLYYLNNKNTKNLITIDLICKGVPPSKVHKKYLKENFSEDEKIQYLTFRSKLSGWSPCSLTEIQTNNQLYRSPSTRDYFMKAFIQNLSIRKSCHNCTFATLKRQSDITIGDFWWIEKYDKSLNDNKGTSLVLTNTDKGKKLFNQIEKNLKISKKIPIRIATKYNGSLNKPSKSHRNRELFFNNLDKMSLKDNVKICLDDKFDIGIINYWWATTNYGALLTGYALQQVLLKLGYSSRLIDNKSMNIKKKSDYIGTFNQKFADKYLYTTEECIYDKDFEALNQKTKIFITGSDQVFSPKWMGRHFEKYFLEFVDIDAKKIAFSASFGVDEDEFNQDDLTRNKMEKALKTFDYISTREKSGVDLCKNIFNCHADWIIDPVFIMEKTKYEEILSNSTEDYSNKIVSYVLDDNEDYQKAYSYLSKKYNCDVVTTYNKNISVENWLSSIKNCRYFITDSFHGACFAIIFNKPFICIINRSRGYARFSSLFSLFNLHHISIESITEIQNKKNIFENLDYIQINKKIEEERIFAINKLKEILESSKKIDNAKLLNYINLLKSRIIDLDNKTSYRNVKKETLKAIYFSLPAFIRLIIKRYFL